MNDKQLNAAFNKLELNHRDRVGSVMQLIKKYQPQNLKEWDEYYIDNVKPESLFNELGDELHEATGEPFEDCRAFCRYVVINRTYQGYEREVRVAEAINKELPEDIQLSLNIPYKWDWYYRIDGEIKLIEGRIGIQIKPQSYLTHNYDNSKKLDIKAWSQAKRDGVCKEVILCVDTKESIDKTIKRIKEVYNGEDKLEDY